MASGTTQRRKICPQCLGSGVWIYLPAHVCVDCDVCEGKGICTPHRYAKYKARRSGAEERTP